MVSKLEIKSIFYAFQLLQKNQSNEQMPNLKKFLPIEMQQWQQQWLDLKPHMLLPPIIQQRNFNCHYIFQLENKI